MANKVERRGGRKKNKWTVVTLEKILGFIKYYEIKQKDFAAHLGVTNSTFHNWKNGKCAPEEEVQVKIQALIDNKEAITVAQTQAQTARTRAPRGASSSTLAALTGSKPKASKKKTKKKTKKKAKKVKAKKKAKKVGRVVRTPRVKTAEPVTPSPFDGWYEVEALAKFIQANPDKTVGDIADLIVTVKVVAEILG